MKTKGRAESNNIIDKRPKLVSPYVGLPLSETFKKQVKVKTYGS